MQFMDGRKILNSRYQIGSEIWLKVVLYVIYLAKFSKNDFFLIRFFFHCNFSVFLMCSLFLLAKCKYNGFVSIKTKAICNIFSSSRINRCTKTFARKNPIHWDVARLNAPVVYLFFWSNCFRNVCGFLLQNQCSE